jgi:hypothetical protein
MQYRTQFNNGTWTDWTTIANNGTITISAEGQTNVQAKATDNAGNTYTTPSTLVELDRTIPTAGLSCPGGATWSNASSGSCTITGSDPNNTNGTAGSGAGTLQYQTQLNGGAWSAWQTSPDGSVSISAEGTTNVKAQVIDNAGNTSTTTSTATVKLDQTAPAPSVSCQGAAGWSNATSSTCTISGSDPTNSSNGSAGSGLQTLQYRTQFNNGAWSPWTTVSSGFQTTVDAEGVTNIEAQTTDNAGNTSTSAPTTVELDQTAPTATVSCPSPGAWSNAASATCTITGSDPTNASNGTNSSGLQTLEYRTQLNGGAWSDWTTVSSGAQVTISDEGTTNVVAQAVDNAGNTYTTPATAVQLDQTAPTAAVDCSSAGTWSNASSVTCTITGSDPTNGSNGSAGSGLSTLDYRTQLNGGAWSAWTSVTNGDQITINQEGVTNIQAQAGDSAGNTYAATQATVQLDQTLPTASLDCPGSGSWSNAASVTCTITGSDLSNGNGIGG